MKVSEIEEVTETGAQTAQVSPMPAPRVCCGRLIEPVLTWAPYRNGKRFCAVVWACHHCGLIRYRLWKPAA